MLSFFSIGWTHFVIQRLYCVFRFELHLLSKGFQNIIQVVQNRIIFLQTDLYIQHRCHQGILKLNSKGDAIRIEIHKSCILGRIFFLFWKDLHSTHFANISLTKCNDFSLNICCNVMLNMPNIGNILLNLIISNKPFFHN